MEMMDAANKGRFKGLWAIGYDLFLTNPDAHVTGRALKSLEFVIVQDMFLNETAREFGSVFLPVASSFEKDGTFMNSERRIQPVRRVIEPVGKSKSEWEIICILARAMGKGEYFNFHSPEDVWDEIRRVWKAGSGITYDRLEKGGIQWPCLSEEDPGTEVLHRETFPIGRRASLTCIDYTPTEEMATEEFPFLLITGRTLTQFNAGTMTMRTGNTVFRPTDVLDISQEDAGRLSVRDGEIVRVRSRYGEAVLKVKISPVLKLGERFSPVRVTPPVKTGEIFSTFTDTKVFINHVTSPHRDGYVQTPEYKVTAVRIEKL
jgi:formate dehydrogenase major subunit